MNKEKQLKHLNDMLAKAKQIKDNTDMMIEYLESEKAAVA